MLNSDDIFKSLINNLNSLQIIEKQNSDEINCRLNDLEKKNRVMIKYLKSMLESLENNYAE